MKITLAPEVEKRVQEALKRGEYPSADVLVQEALGSFLDIEDEEHVDAIRKRLALSEEEVARGEFTEYEAGTIQDLAKDIHERGLKSLGESQKTGR